MNFVLPVYYTCLKMDFEYRNVKREIREIEILYFASRGKLEK
jgi:hypothetical protein